MCHVIPVESFGIAEDCGCFLKWNAMFLEVGNGLRNVPGKHIIVYTPIARVSQDGERVNEWRDRHRSESEPVPALAHD